MKNFMYFESEEGGMGVHDITSNDVFKYLYGWMSGSCKEEDSRMLDWMTTAEIGELYSHRLGYLVRLRDTKAKTVMVELTVEDAEQLSKQKVTDMCYSIQRVSTSCRKALENLK